MGNETKKYIDGQLTGDYAVVWECQITTILFTGTHEECCEYMRKRESNGIPWYTLDLRHIKDGKLWRMASFVL